MGLFSKKPADKDAALKNDLFKIAITFNQSTGTWEELPANVDDELRTQTINTRKLIFEYIRQLKEATVYSNGAVKSFAKEQYPWMNKENVLLCIELGKNL